MSMESKEVFVNNCVKGCQNWNFADSLQIIDKFRRRNPPKCADYAVYAPHADKTLYNKKDLRYTDNILIYAYLYFL